MWMRGTPIVALAATIFLLAAELPPLTAQEVGDPPSDGPECCLLLLVPVGARASSMGGSTTALQGDDAVFVNPAGLVGLDGSAFVIHHSDINVNTQIDAFSLILTPFSTAVGISYQLFDKGDIPTTDPFGQPTGELVLRDHLVVASFATGLPAGLAAGLNYKFFQQRVDCNGQCGSAESVATTHALDLGLRYSPTWHAPLSLGLAVTNAGPGLQVVNAEQSDPLPSRIHLGIAYDVLRSVGAGEAVALRLTGDLRDELRDIDGPTLSFGAELDVQRAIYLRAGYAPGKGLGTGAAVGLELRYDRFDIAVSRSFVNSQLQADTEPFQISFALNF